MLKKNSVKYVLNTYVNTLYIIFLYSFLIALYIKDVKPIKFSFSRSEICYKVTINTIKRQKMRAYIYRYVFMVS